MNPYFNVAGPCIPGEHYMLPAQERCRGILDLIDRKQYFVIHAARQSGKTPLLQELSEQINAEGTYHALYCSLESVERIAEPERGIPAIVRVLATQIRFSPKFSGVEFTAERRAGAETRQPRSTLKS